MSNRMEHGLGGRGVVACALATMLSMSACAPEATDPPDIAMFDMELTQGTTQAGLWQSRTVEYCFQRPLLAEMPSHVRAAVQTQANLDTRFERRKQEFIAAINATWQAVGVLDLVPRATCDSRMFVVRYNKDTPTGGYAGLGSRGGLSVGIQMDSEFLGTTYPWGANTYHTFIAVHEVGHTLGFRHEQDRTDSSCHVSQDFSGTGIALTGYDANSVMNYCNRQATALTRLDEAGFERAYAFLTDDGSEDDDSCRDTNEWCSYWADRGECSRNPGYMLTNCCSSCNVEAPRIVARGSGKCMDVAAGGTSDGANIQQYACNDTGAQAFVLRDAGAGSVNIVNVSSGKCVDVDAGASPNGANVRLWTCNASNAQRFTRRDAGGGFASFVNVASGRCIDVGGGSTANGANILQWTCHGGSNQQWRIE